LGVAWWHVSSGLFLGGPPGGGAITFGRLAGLLASSAMLLQLVLASPLPWLERSVGCDGLVRAHRRLGFALGPGFLAHPTLFVCGPPLMMQAVIATLHAFQIRGSQIHYERFA
jgi:predicted ferric reductase